MQEPYSADFYRGWIIEVSQEQTGFIAVCYSPCRQRLRDYQVYGSEYQAISVAKRMINHHIARNSMMQIVREMYEMGRLSFEEWRSLHHSLGNTANPAS
jgi:hypothetical protein